MAGPKNTRLSRLLRTTAGKRWTPRRDRERASEPEGTPAKKPRSSRRRAKELARSIEQLVTLAAKQEAWLASARDRAATLEEEVDAMRGGLRRLADLVGELRMATVNFGLHGARVNPSDGANVALWADEAQTVAEEAGRRVELVLRQLDHVDRVSREVRELAESSRSQAHDMRERAADVGKSGQPDANERAGASLADLGDTSSDEFAAHRDAASAEALLAPDSLGHVDEPGPPASRASASWSAIRQRLTSRQLPGAVAPIVDGLLSLVDEVIADRPSAPASEPESHPGRPASASPRGASDEQPKRTIFIRESNPPSETQPPDSTDAVATGDREDD